MLVLCFGCFVIVLLLCVCGVCVWCECDVWCVEKFLLFS